MLTAYPRKPIQGVASGDTPAWRVDAIELTPLAADGHPASEEMLAELDLVDRGERSIPVAILLQFDVIGAMNSAIANAR